MTMKKRIFNWQHSKNKRYAKRECPDFDFFKACEKGIVIWWSDTQFCVDMDRLKEVRKNDL